MQKYLFTSESITEGHPDKVCDQISDRIMDALLEQDPMSRCACEVTAEPGAVHIMGEITTNAEMDYEACARQVIRRIGYTRPEYGFTDDCKITCSLHRQSPDIAMGVNNAMDDEKELGAGDQGILIFNLKTLSRRIEVFNMKIIMRRDSDIIYSQKYQNRQRRQAVSFKLNLNSLI